jgi:hypothetical protein
VPQNNPKNGKEECKSKKVELWVWWLTSEIPAFESHGRRTRGSRSAWLPNELK